MTPSTINRTNSQRPTSPSSTSATGTSSPLSGLTPTTAPSSRVVADALASLRNAKSAMSIFLKDANDLTQVERTFATAVIGGPLSMSTNYKLGLEAQKMLKAALENPELATLSQEEKDEVRNAALAAGGPIELMQGVTKHLSGGRTFLSNTGADPVAKFAKLAESLT